MVPPELLNRVVDDVTMHCRRAKGYEEGPWVNPMMPVDCVSAFAMARCLTEQNLFDHYLAVAPEGHVYGYFFEKLGARVLSVHVDYPPTCLETLDELSELRNGRVLVIEDDVISGLTLQFVVKTIGEYEPRSLALYLGRRKADQVWENIAPEFERVYVAEDCLDPALHSEYERQFGEQGTAEM